MLGIVHRKKEAYLSIAGVLLTASPILAQLWKHNASLYVTIGLSVIGLALLVYGTFGIASPAVKIFDEWQPELIRKCLLAAEPNTRIDIHQTSIPDVTRLIGMLEDLLLKHGKSFSFRVLLLDHEKAQALIAARVALRVESTACHVREIDDNIGEFVRMKKRVDKEWSRSRSGTRLDLEIRLYSFLPFGSIFQIGNGDIFCGLFWNYTSSINGPMLRVTRPCAMREHLEKQFAGGWEITDEKGARIVFPPPDHAPADARPHPTTQPSTREEREMPGETIG